MTGQQATCPLCQRTTGTFVHNGRRIYVHHYRPDRINSVEVCDASGWTAGWSCGRTECTEDQP